MNKTPNKRPKSADLWFAKKLTPKEIAYGKSLESKARAALARYKNR